MGQVLLESKGRHISGKIADIDTSAPCCCSAPPAAAAAGAGAGLLEVEVVVVVGKGEGARDACVLEAPPPLEGGAPGGLTVLLCVCVEEEERWSGTSDSALFHSRGRMRPMHVYVSQTNAPMALCWPRMVRVTPCMRRYVCFRSSKCCRSSDVCSFGCVGTFHLERRSNMRRAERPLPFSPFNAGTHQSSTKEQENSPLPPSHTYPRTVYPHFRLQLLGADHHAGPGGGAVQAHAGDGAVVVVLGVGGGGFGGGGGGGG